MSLYTPRRGAASRDAAVGFRGRRGADPANSWAASVGAQNWAIDGGSMGTAASGYSGLPLASRFEGVEDRATGESLQVRGGTSDNRSFHMWFRPTRPDGGHQLVLESGGRIGDMPISFDDATLLF